MVEIKPFFNHKGVRGAKKGNASQSGWESPLAIFRLQD